MSENTSQVPPTFAGDGPIIPIFAVENGRHIGYFESFPTLYANLAVTHWDDANLGVVSFYARRVIYNDLQKDFTTDWHTAGGAPTPIARIAMSPEAMLEAAERMSELARRILTFQQQQLAQMQQNSGGGDEPTGP